MTDTPSDQSCPLQSWPWQSWCDAHALADSVMAGAYETLCGFDRAILKKCIARQHVVWSEYAARESRTRAFRQGFGLVEDDAPAAYALLVCEASYPSPAAFIAALMPALLAGVSAVLPCFISAKDRAGISASLLGALELAGVERAFAASEAEVLALAGLLRPNSGGNSGGGRIVLLGGSGFAESLVLHAHRAGVLCRTLRSEDDADAVGLCRDAAHKDVWFWPDLGPDWFRTRHMRIFALQ